MQNKTKECRRWRVVYHSKGDHRGLEVQIIYNKPIFGGVEVVSVCPIENNPRYSGIRTMGKDKDTIIIKVSFCKCTKILIVKFMEFVPSMNIVGDVGTGKFSGLSTKSKSRPL